MAAFSNQFGLYFFLVTVSGLLVILLGLMLLAYAGRCRRKAIYERYGPIETEAVKRPVKPYRDEESVDALPYYLEGAQYKESCETAPDIMVSQMSVDETAEATGTESPLSIASPALTLEKIMGKLMVTAQYFCGKQKLDVTVREVVGLSSHLSSDSVCNVRMAILPELSEKSVDKYKTKPGKGQTPRWHETFTFACVSQEQLSEKWIRFRLYRRMGADTKREQLMGEAVLRLCLIDGRSETCTNHLLNLGEARHSSLSPSTSDYNMNSRRGSMVDHSGRFCASPSGITPELLVTLCYNDLTGKLVVGIERGSCLGVHSKTPDTMVKVTVLSPYGDEIGKSKTAIVKNNEHPNYGATYVFQVPYSELNYISALIQVYCYLGVWRRRVLIGWLSLGQNCTSESEEDHWKQMISGMGISISKWHILVEP